MANVFAKLQLQQQVKGHKFSQSSLNSELVFGARIPESRPEESCPEDPLIEVFRTTDACIRIRTGASNSIVDTNEKTAKSTNLKPASTSSPKKISRKKKQSLSNPKKSSKMKGKKTPKKRKVRKAKKSHDEKLTPEKLIKLTVVEPGKKRAYNRTVSNLHSTDAAWFSSNVR